MGIYLNPGNDLFKNDATMSNIYVDKTMLIAETNGMMFGTSRHICISRPRRFGKSMAANMLTAYYSRGCDSLELFSKFEISKANSFKKHLNKYNVIKLDIQTFASETDNVEIMNKNITEDIMYEIIEEYPDIKMPPRVTLEKAFATVYNKTQIPFVFIIDEWDCIFRIYKNNKEGQEEYLNFLRNILKEQPYVALDYVTGILPVKKYGRHSTLNMYDEYTMASQAMFAKYTGFTSYDVEKLCHKYDMPMEKMAEWYDGYKVNRYELYNPQSVIRAITSGVLNNYWTKTETFESLQMFIKIDMNGLRQSVIRMIAGEHISVNVDKFQNDMVTFNSADDVITLLIHLGYLTYDFDTKTVWIPNKEVQQEFINCIEDGGWEEVTNALKQSDELLSATLSGDNNRVAEILEEVHQKNTSIIGYNNEMSLSVTLALAYYSARNKYEIFRELPSGKGFADLTFIPRKNINAPAMVIELKYNKSASKALEQIKQKNYTEKLEAFSGEILLVGISYDENKGHSCVIEKIVK